MPALFELAPWQLIALAAVVLGAVSGTVYLARKHLAADAGLPDAVFWDAFAGLAVVVPAVVVSSVASPWAGLMLGLLAAGTAGASYLWAPRLFSRQEARRSARKTVEANAAAAARHGSALARWQRFELDPAYCIDYPAMSDPSRPETAALIRAMKAAEKLRGERSAGYGPAVDQLERALAEAERAAGVPSSTVIAYSTPGISPDKRHLSAEGTR
ncbi:hypothetical protein BJG92_00908 [Arthrobacter sp. SO5]|uniref:hypothetical protein n=1 Tax=Arthrobacter sp. SO5 TaxID=1897055 RepID=UPI001E42E268|nr:hypothetical protein [Arthrobacter sp. SO5]MCB5273387.1 hypothetical protein [Arthrobacter sp. SO5]